MIVYGHHVYNLALPQFVSGIRARLAARPSAPGHDEIVDLLVDLGEACSAVADASSPPDRDDDVDAVRPWNDVLHGVAAALAASVDHDPPAVRAALDRARRAASALDAVADGIRDVRARTAEGFAHYSLFPEQYIRAAGQFAASRDPRLVVCVGIRTIGVPLAHVVAAALERQGVDACVVSVRPRGHPFDRRVALSNRLRARIHQANPTHYAVIDEGPGISGTSFAAAAEALTTLGADASSIVLFPSWAAPSSALQSPRGRVAWSRHDRFCASFESVFAPDPRCDLSAGKWRPRVFRSRAAAWPPVQPQHERRKYLARDGGAARVHRFAGLGRYGRAKMERAAALHAAGFASEPAAVVNGFLDLAWIDGAPIAAANAPTSAMVDRIASYVAFLRAAFPTGRRAAVLDLAEMLRGNAREALEAEALPSIEALALQAAAFDEPEIAVDGRMLPHEWIATASGAVFKTDALDHHADDFLPGSRDIAWDLAGAIVEFDLGSRARARLVSRYLRSSGDRTIARRLRFYEAAYLAYRLGYAQLASRTLGATPDGARFARLMARYRRSLTALARAHRRVRRR